MTAQQWSAWERYYQEQVADEEAHPEDMIPVMACECPPRGEEYE